MKLLKIFLKKKYKNSTFTYTEKEVFSNLENFYSELTSKSFFENEKLIIIKEVSEKIKNEIDTILEKNLEDLHVILLTGILEKKSKLRSFFEKNDQLAITPFYKDDEKTLSEITRSFLKDKKFQLSQELINLIIEKSSNDRRNLKNELNKIENYFLSGKKLNTENLLKLINLSENFSINELINNCLAKNTKKTVKIINENIFSFEDCIIITRSLLLSSKRLLKLILKKEENSNLESLISSYRPPIFWKDKSIVKKQIQNWSVENITNLIVKINEKELLIKRNNQNSLNIITDFLIEQSTITNN